VSRIKRCIFTAAATRERERGGGIERERGREGERERVEQCAGRKVQSMQGIPVKLSLKQNKN